MHKRLALRALTIFIVGGVLMGAVLGITYVMRAPDGNRGGERQTAELVKPGSVPIGGPFELTDHTGETVTEEDFRGRYLLVYFGFTHCPDVCPTTLNDIALALDQLGAAAKAVQPLFITLDPARDTPERMAEYVKAFHPRFVGLTGSESEIADMAEQYKVFYRKVSPAAYYGKASGEKAQGGETASQPEPGEDYMIRHQGNTYLMSSEGEYLAHFAYGTEPSVMAGAVHRAIDRFGDPRESR